MANFFIGIDIGGSKVRGVLIQKFGRKPVRTFVFRMPKTKQAFLRTLKREVASLTDVRKISGIGVALAGMVDAKRGTVLKTPNIPFLSNWDVKKFMGFSRAPVQIDNDSRSFLRAEALYGAGRGYRSVVGLTVGTGIGGGIIVNGSLYTGSHGSAGEFGHTVMDSGKTFEQLGAKRAFQKHGDRSKIVGIGVANLVNALDPDAVILGGGGVLSGRIQFDTVRKTAKRYIMSPPAKDTLIKKGILGDFAQAIGAALLFR